MADLTPEALTELERLEEQGSTRPWTLHTPAAMGEWYIGSMGTPVAVCCALAEQRDEANARLILALHDAAPALIAAARELADLKARTCATCDRWKPPTGDSFGFCWDERGPTHMSRPTWYCSDWRAR